MVEDYMFKDEVLKGKEGDENALQSLLGKLQPLLKSICFRYKHKHHEYEDLLQEGCIAVLEAVKQYDPKKGLPFLSFVKMKTEYRMMNLHKKTLKCLPLDGSLSDSTISLIDTIKDPQAMDEEVILNKQIVRDAINRLTHKQAEVIFMYYFLEKSLKEISKELKLHYQSVVMLKKRGVSRLRMYLKSRI